MFMTTVAYIGLAPSLAAHDCGWKAWETFCKAVKDERPVSVMFHSWYGHLGVPVKGEIVYKSASAEWDSVSGFHIFSC